MHMLRNAPARAGVVARRCVAGGGRREAVRISYSIIAKFPTRRLLVAGVGTSYRSPRRRVINGVAPPADQAPGADPHGTLDSQLRSGKELYRFIPVVCRPGRGAAVVLRVESGTGLELALARTLLPRCAAGRTARAGGGLCRATGAAPTVPVASERRSPKAWWPVLRYRQRWLGGVRGVRACAVGPRYDLGVSSDARNADAKV